MHVADLTRRLRQLTALAASGGADPVWLDATSEQMVDALIELAHRRRLDDPRRLRTLTLARAVQRAAKSMAGLPAAERNRLLRERFGVGRSRVYQLLHESTEVVDGSVLDSERER